MKNSLFEDGRTPRLSMTGRGGSTGTWRNGARTVARSAMGHAGAGRASRTTQKQGFGTWTNRGRFELAGGQCYEFRSIFLILSFSFHASYSLFSLFHISSFHFDWSCASKAALVNMQHDFYYLHTACR